MLDQETEPSTCWRFNRDIVAERFMQRFGRGRLVTCRRGPDGRLWTVREGLHEYQLRTGRRLEIVVSPVIAGGQQIAERIRSVVVHGRQPVGWYSIW